MLEVNVEAVDVTKANPTYARGETPVLTHLDELSYFKENETDDGSVLDGVKKQVERTFSGNRAQRRKAAAVKKKPAPKHVVNTQRSNIKAALGSVILNKLGQVQRDTTDAVKREILKEVPLSGFVEAVTGTTLPAYQKRLFDLQQARADGTLKPELSELGEGAVPYIKEQIAQATAQ